MKLRSVGALLVAALATVGATAAQNRPSFTGTWKFVADKSTPANIPVFGNEFRISHEANALVLELPTKEFVRTSDGKFAPVADGGGAPMAFKTDGDDHVMLPLNPMQSTDERTTFNLIPGGPYRVSWKGTSLVINSSDQIPMTTLANDRAHIEFPRRLITTTFSMNPDGTLTVERITERDPADKGEIVVSKTELKSVYRKAS